MKMKGLDEHTSFGGFLKGRAGRAILWTGTGEMRAVVVEPILYQEVKFVKENLSGLDSEG